jgi:hypothetical protein
MTNAYESSNYESNPSGRQETIVERPQSSKMHLVAYAAIAIALIANGFLLVHAHNLSNQLANVQATTQAQIAKMAEQINQANDNNGVQMEAVARQARESVAQAEQRARDDSRRYTSTVAAKWAKDQQTQQEAQQQVQEKVAGQLDELKQASTVANSKLNDISGDVNGVRGDLTNTRSTVDQTVSELKRVNGDMGVMSGLIATNGKQLAALRELGERNYIEFDLTKKRGLQKVGDIQLALQKSDAKRNRFTLDVMADDKRVEKRDKTINEPVQLYVAGARLPYEIVVNEVKKDEVVGYLAVPKVAPVRASARQQ